VQLAAHNQAGGLRQALDDEDDDPPPVSAPA